MILQCDDRQLRAGLARRRATKVSNYLKSDPAPAFMRGRETGVNPNSLATFSMIFAC